MAFLNCKEVFLVPGKDLSYNVRMKAGEVMVIGIIGGGASGMAAALSASENPNARVILFERQARVGRKLQATGNGRCNLSNLNASKQGYHGEDASFAAAAIARFDPEETLVWFRDLGLFRAGISLFGSVEFCGGCAAVCAGKTQYFPSNWV